MKAFNGLQDQLSKVAESLLETQPLKMPLPTPSTAKNLRTVAGGMLLRVPMDKQAARMLYRSPEICKPLPDFHAVQPGLIKAEVLQGARDEIRRLNALVDQKSAALDRQRQEAEIEALDLRRCIVTQQEIIKCLVTVLLEYNRKLEIL